MPGNLPAFDWHLSRTGRDIARVFAATPQPATGDTMDPSQQSTWNMYRERGIGRRGGKGSRPALLIVDVTNGFTDPDAPLGSDLSAEIAAIAQLLEAARSRGIPVCYSTNLLAPDDPGGARFLAKVPAIDSLRPGTRAVEVDSRIAPQPGEVVVEKTVPSAFFGTGLGETLHAQGVDTVIVTGCSTSGCVRASVTDSMSHGFHTLVVAEAVGDRAQGPHLANLFDMDTKLGDVIALAEALDYLEAVPEKAVPEKAELEKAELEKAELEKAEPPAPIPGAGR